MVGFTVMKRGFCVSTVALPRTTDKPQAHPLHRLDPSPGQPDAGELGQTGGDGDGGVRQTGCPRALLLFTGSAAAAEPDAELTHWLEAIVRVHAEIPAEARTAACLGTARDGSGVVIDEAGPEQVPARRATKIGLGPCGSSGNRDNSDL